MEIRTPSLDIHLKHKHLAVKHKVKECYTNVLENLHDVQEPNLKVVFCMVQSLQGIPIYTRHACYSVEGHILDLTLYKAERGYNYLDGREYRIVKEYDVKEYMEAIESEYYLGGTIDLSITLKKDWDAAERELLKEGKGVIG